MLAHDHMLKKDLDSSEKLRLHLEQEFEKRSQKNPQYSLRAFAKSLGVDSSYLSKVLSKKRSLNGKALYSFAEKLSFPAELDFITEQESSLEKKSLELTKFNELSIDEFKVISDWYHYAILEAIHLDDFVPDIKWISIQLNIPYGEAYAAVHRLQRLGLLKIEESGKWTSKSNTTTKNKFSTNAFRNLQKQILEQAIVALEQTAIEERDQSSITMSIDRARLPEAKEKIKKFRREMMQFLENGKSKDEVYQLSISLFPVTQNYKTQTKKKEQ
jgi:transcriptional regulator with XRE-family HTH domain